MKKQDFLKLALMGVASGLLVTNAVGGKSLNAAASDSAQTKEQPAGNDYSSDNGNMGYHVLSEDELLLELNPKGEALYESLSDEGKALARRVASQRCNGTNECAGLNACQTEEHGCAGQGSCKGTGKCGFSDKNLAVKVAAKKMAEKRQNASASS